MYSTILKLFFVSLMALTTLGEDEPSAHEYLLGIQKLIPGFNAINLFDGPSNISSAPITTPVMVSKPTLEDMMYYNYYTAAINCAYQVQDLSCYYCPIIKKDIACYTVLNDEVHDTSALVAVSETRKEIVVAFRATENFWNTILDVIFINVTPDPASQIKIHKGFYIAAMSLYDDVVKTIGAFRLYDNDYETYKIVITGHSLGAAMARVTSFFLMYCNQFPDVKYEVYTYGEPRSGNKYYIDYLNAQPIVTARITDRADLVCHLAPTSILGTTIVSDYYYHALHEYWIKNESQQMSADPSLYEDPSCANSMGPLYSAVDHFQYFDVNHLKCLSDVQEFLAVPVILHPVDVLPPFPKFIQITLSDLGDLLITLLLPIA